MRSKSSLTRAEGAAPRVGSDLLLLAVGLPIAKSVAVYAGWWSVPAKVVAVAVGLALGLGWARLRRPIATATHVVAAVVVAATFWLGRRGLRHLLREGPRARLGKRHLRRWVRSVGLLPLFPTTADRSRTTRLLAGLTAVAASLGAVAALDPGDQAVALLLGTTALLAWGGLVAIEIVRLRRHRKAPATVRPDRAVLWAITPLWGAATVTLVVLAVQGHPSKLSGADWADLVLLTAIGEEIIFRGALLSLAHAQLRRAAAPWCVAASFVLWHVGNELDGHRGQALGRQLLAITLMAVTTAAGSLIFTWFRYRTRSLLGPVGGHLVSNLPGKAIGLTAGV